MQSNLAGWLARLETCTLPVLPGSAAALLRLVRDDDSPLPEYAAVIENDPGFTLALLRRARSPHTRRLNTEITTIEHALMLLGLTQVRALLPTLLPMEQALADKSQRDHLLALYARANHAAFQAQAWARQRKDMEPDEVQCVALLHDMAEMLLWLKAPAEMVRLQELSAGRKATVATKAEQEILGVGLAELGSALAQRWGLPSLLHECLSAEGAASPRITEINLAVELARAAEHGWYTEEVTGLLERIADHLRIGFDATVTLVHRTAVEAARALPEPQFTAAARLLHPPPSTAERGPAQPTATTGRLPQPRLLRQALHELHRHESGGMSRKEVLQLAMETMHQGIGLERVLFASLSQDRRTLKARGALCPGEDLPFRHFEVDVGAGGLLDQLMRKAQALWLNETNRERFAPLLPVEFRKLVGSDSFFLLSLFVGERPLGLFYADRRNGSRGLDATAYHQFKELGLQAARTLAGTPR